MKYKRGLLAMCLIICLFGIATASASDINDTVLTSNNDLIENESTSSTEILSANPDGTFTDLANEIASATDELNLTRNYVYSDEDSQFKNGIVIDKSIKINGNGFTINGTQASVFDICSPDVILNNIDFTKNADEKSCIIWSGENGRIINCNFINITSTDNGGILSWSGLNGIISKCNFLNSYADGNCAISIIWFGINGTITNCNFINSKADRYGTIVSLDGDNVTIKNCKFINNSLNEGFSIAVISSNVNIKNCNFINTTSQTGGCNIKSFGLKTSIINCNFTNSDIMAVDMDRENQIIKNCNFKNFRNTPVSFSKSNGILSNCNFTNITYYADGGAVYWSGDNGTVTNCNFKNISVDWSGGAIYWFANNGTVTDCNFENTHAVWGGGAIQWEGWYGTVSNCNFTDTTAFFNGGAINWRGDYGTLLPCKFKNSKAGQYGNNIYWTGIGGISDVEVEQVEVKINAQPLTTTYNSARKMVVTLLNKNNVPIREVKISVIIGNTTLIYETDATGIIYAPISGISSGSYNAKINVPGLSFKKTGTTTAKVVINKADMKLTAKFDESNKNIIATVKDDNNRAIKNIKIGFVMPDGVKYVTTDVNGQAKYSVKDLSHGSYTVQVAFLGNDNYNPSNKEIVKFTINKISTKLTAKYDAKSKNIVAVVKDANGKPVSGLKVGFAINGVKYVTTDANGEAKYSTADLADNTYTVNVLAYGNEIYENSNKQTVTFTIGNKQQAKIFLRNALYFVLQTKMVQVTLWDATNKPLAGKTVYLKLDEYSWKHSGVTDENGNAYIKVGVGFGVHGATVSFEGDENYTSNSKTGAVRVIKETPSLMLPGKYTKFKASDATKTVKIYLKDRYNKPLLPNTKVFIKVNGQTYVGQINNEGIASINININQAGTYNAELIYMGNTAYNKVIRQTKITIV